MFRIEDGGPPEVLVTLNKHVHDWHVNAYPDIFRDGAESELASYFRSSMDNPSFHHYLAYDDPQAVGFVQAEVRESQGTSFRQPRRLVYVHIIVILPEYRGKGVGHILMDEVYKLAAEHDISRIELDHWAGNESASEFFVGLGFKPYRYFLFLERE